MITVQKAIFPGLALGCMFLVLVTGIIGSPQIGFAASAPALIAAEELVSHSAMIDQPTPIPSPEVTATADPLPTEVPPDPVENVQDTTGESTCAVSSSFPASVLQWCDWITKYAHESGVDPNLIAAVMQQESAGNPDAYSKSGAVGLMQVMPRDGIATKFMCVNGPCFASRPSIAELKDPEFNISYGTRMLAGLINKRGSVREGLRSYGPMDMGYRYADLVIGIWQRNQ